ncbi:galactose-3-O-sulfotransferase 3-like [Anneissia japonica]|uniref:galactose-3-O-sulfotransferase 3-like n=1 Tax=Anneissia japonica TaxID=1529436 RepID=UPI001425799E|nr:galactose-3-O-sulfotransferase 3-like [Anneissia japonica]
MQPDPVYISILRDPVKQLESAFTFFNIDKAIYGVWYSLSFEAFMKRPKLFTPRINKDKQPYIHNNQMYDFGLDEENFKNIDFINKTIRQLDREMDLVLINEFYEESLVLLSKVLCWDLQDMVYISTNMRGRQHIHHKIGKDLRRQIRGWNSADVMLYDYFVKRLHERIAEYGPSFADDFATFKRLQFNFETNCPAKKSKMETSKTHLNDNDQARCNYFRGSAAEMDARLRKAMKKKIEGNVKD